MTRIHDLLWFLQRFLVTFLKGRVSDNTLLSYRDTFRLLLLYTRECWNIPESDFDIINLNTEVVNGYLRWLEEKRNCKPSTVKVRYQHIVSFCRFMLNEAPDIGSNISSILNIRLKRVYPEAVPRHFTKEQIAAMFDAIDGSMPEGLRDKAIFGTLYEGGLRVQELCNICVCDVHFEQYSYLSIVGKGNKPRIVYLSKRLTSLLKTYIESLEFKEYQRTENIFRNQWGRKISRHGVAYTLEKYYKLAKEISSLHFPDHISPHMLRHSRAMHLKSDNIDLMDIRDFLGHSHVSTTEIYARNDGKSIQEALKTATSVLGMMEEPIWEDNPDILVFLDSFRPDR